MKEDALTLDEQNKIIVDNIPLVIYLIRRYIYIGHDEFEDLFQEGCKYLVMAARRFEPSKGYKFSTYASNLIILGVKRYKRELSNEYHGLKLSRSMIDKKAKIEKRISEDPTINKFQLAMDLGVSVNELDNLPKFKFSSLDQPVNDNEENLNELGSIIPDNKNEFENIVSEDTLEYIMKELRNRLGGKLADIAEEIIYSYDIGGKRITQLELSNIYGCSQPNIARKLKKIKNTIREIVKDLN